MADHFTESLNVARMHASSTMKAAQKAAELRAQGHSVTDLTVGEPDFDTPKFIKEYAVEGISKGITKYTASSGMPDLRQSVAEFYAMCFGAEIDPGQVAAACGGKQALFNAACTLLNPGDDVLIPKPYWVTFPEISTFCVANNVFIDTMETGFVLNADQVKRSITDRTKLLIINSPNNPTGRVIPPDEMVKIVEVCAERGVYVLTDECYLFFTYKPTEPYSLAVLPKELRDLVCIAGSFSKTFAMTGWRIGYTIASEKWTKAMVKLQSHSATHPTSFVQYACAKALRDTEKTLNAVASMLEEYAERRAWFIPALNTVDGFKCAMPEGAFYAFVDVRGLLGDRFKTSADVAEHLLNEAYVVVTDGAAFGAEGFLRLSYAASMETLRGAVDRMHRVFGKK
ncbi:MAG: pyridoxal phosphate-dependent aminotransferase [Acidobacteria bacterium]|nr:pyridoxal phosphate-dependent aminotransferase [Acidobacteriota bacterium]